MTENKQEKIYIGSGKQITGTYGTFRKTSICLTDIPEEHTFEYNGKKYLKIIISDKREPDNYGKDVSVSVDTWKPEQGEGKSELTKGALDLKSANDDLPF